jgi:hypothetical protein
MAVCVGPPDVIAKGSATVLIGNMPAARLGDTMAHGGAIVMGCPTVMIGDSGGGGSGGGGGAGGFAQAVMKFLKKEVEQYAASTAISLGTQGAADLIKVAGDAVYPILKQIAPSLAEITATDSETAGAIAKALGDNANIGVQAGAAAIISPVVNFAERAIEHKPLFSKAAVFDYATSAVTGALSAAITGAIVGSVFPGPGTVVGFVGGLAIGLVVSIGVDAAATPLENSARTQLGIQEDDST